MTDQTGKSKRGTWLVIALVGLGVSAGLLAVTYWSGKLGWSPVPTTQPSPPESPPGAGGGKRSAAEEELAAGREALARAIEAGVSDPVVMSEARRLAGKHPKMAEARMFLAQALLYDRRFEPAYEEVKAALALEAGVAEIHLLAGTIASNLNRYDQAIEHCRRAIELQPAEAKYRVHLSQSLIRLGRIDIARAELAEALRMDSNRHDAYATQSELLAMEGQWAAAIGEMDKALEHTPISQRQDVMAYTRRKARLLRQDGKPEDALAVLALLTEKELVNPEVVEDVAISWQAAGRPARAAQAYETAQQRAPMNWRLAEGAARWWIAAGRFESARAQISIMRRLNPRLLAIARLEERIERAQTQPASIEASALTATAPAPTDEE